MRRTLLIAIVVAITTLFVPPAVASSGAVIRGSVPMSSKFWDCVTTLYAQSIPVQQALDECAVSRTGPNGETFGTGISDPYGGFLGRAQPTERQVKAACGQADPGISAGDGGTPLTKAEVDKLILAAWKEYLAARERGDTLGAEKSYADWQQLHNSKAYAPNGRTGPLTQEQCQHLQAAAQAMDVAIRTCDANGWQSSHECRELATLLFACADPTISLTTGDYACGGKPTKQDLVEAQQHAYLICSALRRGGPGNDPCKQAEFGQAVLQGLIFEHDKCNDPNARWETCGDPVDVETALQGLTPSSHPILTEICAKLGGPGCLMPDRDPDPLPPRGPGGPK